MRHLLGLTIAFLLPTMALAQPVITGDGSVEGIELLTQGPIHEAFAEPIALDAEATVVIPKAPPEPVPELPPESRPDEEGVLWIPGYWAWDFERDDFIWISGVWRVPPPRQVWVPGYWTEVDGGSQWVSGFWSLAETQEVNYLPAPPRSLEQGPSRPTPGEEYFWAPGTWVWQNDDYIWQAGYWTPIHQNWTWVAPHYSYTPGGYVFIPGYWDYLLSYRGVLFAPAYYSQPLYTQVGYYYSPSVVIDASRLVHCLFVRPNYGHYYFGAYYNTPGYSSWYSYGRGNSYDPFFAYYNWSFGRRDRNWIGAYDDLYRHRSRADFRMPRTFNEQRNWQNRGDRESRDLMIARSLSDTVRNKDSSRFSFEQISRDQRERFGDTTRAHRDFQKSRLEIESRGRGSVAFDRDRGDGRDRDGRDRDGRERSDRDRDGRDRDGRDRDGRDSRSDAARRSSMATLRVPDALRDAANASARGRTNVPDAARSRSARDSQSSGRSAFQTPANSLERARRNAQGSADRTRDSASDDVRRGELGRSRETNPNRAQDDGERARDATDRARDNIERARRGAATPGDRGPQFPTRDQVLDRTPNSGDSSRRGRDSQSSSIDPRNPASNEVIQDQLRRRQRETTSPSDLNRGMSNSFDRGSRDALERQQRDQAIESFRQRQSGGQNTFNRDPSGSNRSPSQLQPRGSSRSSRDGGQSFSRPDTGENPFDRSRGDSSSRSRSFSPQESQGGRGSRGSRDAVEAQQRSQQFQQRDVQQQQQRVQQRAVEQQQQRAQQQQLQQRSQQRSQQPQREQQRSQPPQTQRGQQATPNSTEDSKERGRRGRR